MTDILNHRGKEGWELVQIAFGKDGMMAYWKRKWDEYFFDPCNDLILPRTASYVIS